ncbi:hypothetical protein LO771_21020 [Streptacidiphilus sp. ASG 303]|uniref:hypothetical protein n=1 Tax=Streptacidiphilus sp. ASG 303 TaxID=2896847 RepID=UPI001E57C610|nr:hypothetical protein [Streptacidiphilus sp. ASG 303]MCD0484807.1 hypothetical protein [Streptacidiphilus sp. ASG 303]
MLHAPTLDTAADPVPAEHAELVRMAYAGQLQPRHFARLARIAATHPQLSPGAEGGRVLPPPG